MIESSRFSFTLNKIITTGSKVRRATITFSPYTFQLYEIHRRRSQPCVDVVNYGRYLKLVEMLCLWLSQHCSKQTVGEGDCITSVKVSSESSRALKPNGCISAIWSEIMLALAEMIRTHVAASFSNRLSITCLARTKIVNIMLFPKPVGKTARTSFPKSSSTATSCCSFRKVFRRLFLKIFKVSFCAGFVVYRGHNIHQKIRHVGESRHGPQIMLLATDEERCRIFYTSLIF